MGYTAKQISLAIIPKCTGFLSLLGSSYIFFDVISSRKKRSQSVYHRIILALSISDIIASIVNVLSTWPIPSDTSNVFGASGTTQTCTVQGLFNEIGNISTPLFNASLCTYYYVVIRRGWSERRIKKTEKWLIIPPILVGLIMGFIGLPLMLYNNSGWLCWIAPYPSGCHLTNTCTRGELANVFRWIHYAIIWSAIFYVTVGMFLIYNKVRKRENKTRKFTVFESPKIKEEMKMAIQNAAEEALKYDSDGENYADNVDLNSHQQHDVSPNHHGFAQEQQPQEREDKTTSKKADDANYTCCCGILSRKRSEKETKKKSKTRKVADQAMLFVSALYLTWIFTTLTRIFQITQGKTYYPLLVLMAIFFPLQGFFNASIYLRPRYLRIRAAQPDMKIRNVLYYTLKSRNEKDAIFSRKSRSGVGRSFDDESAASQNSGGSFFNHSSSEEDESWLHRRVSAVVRRLSTPLRRKSTGSSSPRSSRSIIETISGGKKHNLEDLKQEHNDEEKGKRVAAEEISKEDNNHKVSIRWEIDNDYHD